MKYRIYHELMKKYINLENENLILNEDGILCDLAIEYPEDIGSPYVIREPIEFQKEYIIELSTGLFDKNGKEIYEGDVVLDSGTKYTIAFGNIGYDGLHNGLTGFGFKERDGYDNFIELWYQDDYKDLEVIGNIHEESK